MGLGILGLSGVAITLFWVVFAGGGPNHKTYWDVPGELGRSLAVLLVGWLLLHVRNACDAIAALIADRRHQREGEIDTR